MKQYVLDEPVGTPAPLGDPMDALTRPRAGWWRSVVLVLLLEPLALAILYAALSGDAAAGRAEPAGIAYVAAFSFPRQDAGASAQEPAALARPSRIAQERGRYVIELHDEPLAPALALLTETTRARVTGSGIFLGSPLRLTRSAVASSPRDAWQAVFGDVANFAIACAGSVCDVHFVSLVKADALRPSPGAPLAAPTQAEQNVAALPGSAVAAPPVAAPPVQTQTGAIASTESAEAPMPDN